MLTTAASYTSTRSYSDRSQTTNPADPCLDHDVAYYPASIGKVTSTRYFVNNYQLFSLAPKAFDGRDRVRADALGAAPRKRRGNPGGRTHSTNGSRLQACTATIGFTARHVPAVVALTAAMNTCCDRKGRTARARPLNPARETSCFEPRFVARGLSICSSAPFPTSVASNGRGRPAGASSGLVIESSAAMSSAASAERCDRSFRADRLASIQSHRIGGV